MELEEKDSTDSSEKVEPDDWGVMFSRMMKTYPSLTPEGICKLSYPQFKVLYKNIYNKNTFTFTIPYMGSSKDEEKEVIESAKSDSKASNVLEVQQIIAQMNSEFSGR